MITTEQFVKAVEYAKKAACRPYATIAEISRMLGCRRFDVMHMRP